MIDLSDTRYVWDVVLQNYGENPDSGWRKAMIEVGIPEELANWIEDNLGGMISYDCGAVHYESLAEKRFMKHMKSERS